MARYDLAVMGVDLGGLSCAALLSSKGRKPVVFGRGPDLATSIGGLTYSGFSFAPGPALHTAPRAGGTMDQLFADIKAGTVAAEEAGGFQVALPDRRISLARNRERWRDELKREFAQDRQHLERFFRDLDRLAAKIAKGRIAAFFAKRKSAAALLRRYAFSRELQAFFALLSRFFQRMPPEHAALDEFVDMLLRPPSRAYGQRVTVATRLMETILKNGGEVRFGDGVDEVLPRSRRFEVKAASGSLDADTVLLSQPDARQSVLYAGIRDTVIPVGMGNDVIYLPDYAKPDEFLSLSLSDEKEASSAPSGARALTCVFNGMEASLPKEEMIRLVGRLMPFLSDFIVVSEVVPDVPQARIPQDVHFKSVHSGVGGAVLFQGTIKGIYRIAEDRLASGKQIRAARRLMKKIS